MPIVTLTTDFGEGSRYVAAMKGVIYSLAPDVTLVDLTHAVPPQDIAAGAMALEEMTCWFPAGTLHVAVVDPGVGSDRRLVYVEIGSQRYLCPDNGLLTCLAAREPPRKIVEVSNPALWAPTVSRTFHGRDILAPVAARLATGLPVDEVGATRQGGSLITIPLTRGRRVGQRIDGRVVEVDSFGNLITDITATDLADTPRDESVTVTCDGHFTVGIYGAYSDQPEMTLIALIGSGGRLELAIVNDSAADMLGVRPGAPVRVDWG